MSRFVESVGIAAITYTADVTVLMKLVSLVVTAFKVALLLTKTMLLHTGEVKFGVVPSSV